MEDYASGRDVFVAILVFARVGAILMLLPGLGESAVPPRSRLGLGLILTLILVPLINPIAGPTPETMSGLIAAFTRELLIGLMIGAMLKLFFSSLAVAGEIVSLQTTLSFSQTASPLDAQPTASLSTFLTLMGITLLFATNLHHYFITGIFGSFTIFKPGHDLPIADASTLAIQTVGKSFALGVQLAAPVIVFALVFNVATGLVGRVMPQFQVFFVASPLAVIFGLSIFALSLGTLGLVWIDRYRDLAAAFVRPR